MPAALVVQHRYRVDPLDRPQLLLLLAHVRAYALDLGVASFCAWQDQDDPWMWTELHGYDSWSHYVRLSQKPLDAAMLATYEALAKLQVGGEAAVSTQFWTPVVTTDSA